MGEVGAYGVFTRWGNSYTVTVSSSIKVISFDPPVAVVLRKKYLPIPQFFPHIGAAEYLSIPKPWIRRLATLVI